jgi:hypothetical protein
MKRIATAFLLIILAAPAVLADTIYLRDGRTVRGTLLGFINGRFAIRVRTAQPFGQTTSRSTVDEGEVQFFRPREVERVEIDGRSLDDARFQTRNVDVGLGPNWIDSGVDLRRGQRVQVDATGTIVAGRSRITPSGLGRPDPNAPLPRAAEGLLIGALSDDPNAPIIEIGQNREFVAEQDGRLYLTVNRANYTDARGAYNVKIRTELPSVPRGRQTGQFGDEDDSDGFGTNQSEQPAPTRPRTQGGQSGNDQFGGNRPTPREPREVTIQVPGNSRGTNTGVELRAGDQVTISATGNIVAGRRAGSVTPDGGRPGFGSVVGTYPVPNAGVGALIGYIQTANGQTSQPFLVGSQGMFTAPSDGMLVLLVNDDNYADNSGSFTVKIRH